MIAKQLRSAGWWVIGLLLVAGFAEVIARVALDNAPPAVRWYDEAAALKIEQMGQLETVDVVFAGTSMAWQAFVPSVYTGATGASSYNAGLNGGTPEIMERWLLEEVVPRLEPATVIWGLSSYDIAPNYGEQQRTAYDGALNTRQGILADLERWSADRSRLVENRTILRSLNEMFGHGADDRRENLATAKSRLGPDGERLDYRIDRGVLQHQITQARLRDFTPDEADIETIHRVVDELHEQGIAVILVELPVPNGFISAHPNGGTDHAQTSAALSELSESLDTRFLRLTDGFADEDFVDDAHLNEAAAHTLTEQLALTVETDRDDRGIVDPAPPSESAAQRDDCSTRTVVDDYGFEIVIEECGDAPTTTEPTAAPPAPQEVDEATRTALSDRDRLCESGQNPGPALLALVDAIEAETARLEGSYPYEIEAAYELTLAAALDSGSCNTPNENPALTEATAKVTGALDRMADLRNVRRQRASAIWGSHDTLATAIWIREALAAETDVNGLILGNSIAISAIDPVALGDLTGTTVGQASVGGTGPEAMGPWVDEIVELTDPETIYWAVSYYDLYGVCGLVQARADQAAELHDRRASAFAGLVKDESRASWDQLLGPAGTESYGRSPLLDLIDVEETVRTLGRTRLTTAAPQEDQLQNHISQIGDIWTPGEPCTARDPYVVEAIAALRAAGRQVVMFIIPPNPRFAEQRPGGIDEYFDHAGAVVGRAGPDRTVELTPLGDNQFRDGIHFLETGRARLTEELAAALNS